tara:strand:+ start:1227 stop:1436 length:210 start_codon:yes stop_codon:yes gene_type:complete
LINEFLYLGYLRIASNKRKFELEEYGPDDGPDARNLAFLFEVKKRKSKHSAAEYEVALKNLMSSSYMSR